MATRNFTISGRILNTNGQPLPGCRIEAWDLDMLIDDFVGEAVSDSSGNFRISFTHKRFMELFLDARPDIYFKIFETGLMVHSTEKSVLWNIGSGQTELSIVLPDDTVLDKTGNAGDTEGIDSTISFSGHIKHDNDNPVENMKVQLSVQLLRGKNFLTQTLSGTDGSFSLQTNTKPTGNAFIIDAVNDEGLVLVSSPVIFEFSSATDFDLIITDEKYKGISLFQQRNRQLGKYFEQINTGGTQISLSIEDVYFIANKTRIEPRDVFQWLKAKLLETETGISAEAFYGMFKTGLPTDVEKLSSISGSKVNESLLTAAKQSFITAQSAKQTDQIIDTWNKYISGKVLSETPHKMDGSLSDILSIAFEDKNIHGQIITSYLGHEGTIDDYWTKLGKLTGDNNASAKLQAVLQLGTLTANQPDLMQALASRKYAGPNMFHELAAMEKEDWVNYLNELSAQKKKSMVPSFIEGSEQERVDIFAGELTGLLETNFHTQSFFGKLAGQNSSFTAFSAREDLLTFFADNPDFDILTSPTISILNNDSSFVLENITDKTLFTEEIQGIQRLSSYTTSFKAISALKSDGMDAAYNIVNMPAADFVKTYAAVLGSEAKAQQVYAKAETTYMSSAMMWSGANTNLNLSTGVTPDPISDPTLRTMFGTLDACECEHCTSVFSPSAYLADILNFLYSRALDVYNELVRRRPDLVHIDLNCDNTNTPLPYIDLVNELLESFISRKKGLAAEIPSSYQSTWQPAELAANPEHTNYPAYDELKDEVYPRVLPFNLPLEEIRVYLKHLGVEKHLLMSIFFPGTRLEAFDDFNINMESLGISPQEALILSGETTGGNTEQSGLWNFYGFDKSLDFQPLTDPADSGKQISEGSWDTALTGRVDVFLQQTDLVYKDLLTLLLCNNINPLNADGSRSIAIVSIDGDNASCALDNLQLTGISTVHLSVIHRFLRLQRKLGWSMFDLDRAMTAFALSFGDNTDQNRDNLSKIAQSHFLSRQLHLPLVQLLSFWFNISTDSYIDYYHDNYPPLPSLYETLFTNKAVANPVDPAFENPLTLSGVLDDSNAGAIVSALQISDEDYTYLKAVLPDTGLTLENLSKLYRHVRFAGKLKLNIRNFLSLMDLLGNAADPFATPSSTFSFLLKADTVKSSGFSIDQLNYILRHDFLEETSIAPTDDDISIFLSELRASLRAIETATADEQQDTIVQKFSEKLKITTTTAGLLLKTYVKSITDSSISAVFDFRSDTFDSFSYLQIYTADDGTIFEPSFISGDTGGDTTVVSVPALFSDYIRLNKIATVINKLKLSDTDIEAILVNSSTMLCTDLTQLPVIVTSADFEQFEKLVNLIKARDLMPTGSIDFFTIIGHAITFTDKSSWVSDLLSRTNWDESSVTALTGAATDSTDKGILGADFPSGYTNGDLILRIRDCLSTLTRIGLSTSLISEAVITDPDSTISDAIKNASKAKYDEQQWLKLAKPLRDGLREKQREALVAYVIAGAAFNPSEGKYERWKDSDELYEYLLIDVEMKPISMTSRIKQAICSVQLFIDRVLMNLEHPNTDPSVSALKLDGDQVEEWKEWRRVYRVWEANRKIFLYPENWLEPELRDDKSPFFKDLETLLKQNELTNDNVEDAFHNYLNKLDEVARLEIVGIYHQVETGIPDEDDIDILHIFGRTNIHPYKYFHRTLEDGEWTAWQKLEIDIDGNHMVPAVFNRKLCLFWLFFSQDSEESDSATDSTPRFWKIQAAWSEYRKNKWTAKRLSGSYLESEHYTSKADMETYRDNLVMRHWINEEGNDFATPQYDGKLHLSLNNFDGLCYIDGEECGGASFLFENTNTDPDLIEESLFSSFLLPDNTDYVQQMVKSNKTGTALSLRVEKTYTTSGGGLSSWAEQIPILNNSKQGRFKLLTPACELSPYNNYFFFQDKTNTFFVTHSTQKAYTLGKADYAFGDWQMGINQSWGKLYNSYVFSNGNVLPTAIADKPTGNNSLLLDDYFQEPVADTTRITGIETAARTVELQGATVNIHAKNTRSETPASYQVQQSRVSFVNDSFLLPGSYTWVPVTNTAAILSKLNTDTDSYTFNTFYHAHIRTFIKELYKNGIEGLLIRDNQVLGNTINFETDYEPSDLVANTPSGAVDFTYGSAYGQYNWELFFHVPMLIACRLKEDQRFEEARDWFHYIFNPTNSEGGDKERFWQFKPFYDEAGTTIETLDDLLKNETELTEQVEKWMDDPFNPHLIARMRISAYMKNIVMKYIDNLVAWGDNLFRRDSIEAINEATNLYILAARILGERPDNIPPRAAHADAGFDDMKDQLDVFSNAMVQIETMLSTSAPAISGSGSGSSNALGEMFYFCVPRNEYLMQYWDTVADRLFKIRHSMNIEGVVRTLPLFEPPIDPAMLVRAAAAGMDVSSILSDMNATMPYYRFSFMLQKAHEFTSEVKALGASLLQALEKRDAESLSLLRSTHEQKLLSAVLTIKEKQVDDAKTQLENVSKTKEITQLKYNYYSSREFMNNYEKQQLNSIQTGMLFSVIQGELNTIGGVLAAIPNLKAGAPTSMGVTWGGDNLGAMMNAVSSYMGIYAALNNAQGSMAATLGGYTRRMDDWKFQTTSSQKELEQLDKQVLSAEIRLAIAEKELSNQQLQIDNNNEADEFMRSKFTNQELYDWMIGQLSTVYFQSYQLVYDLAKKAEQCFQYELGEYDNTSFVQFGYWDSLKKGLLSAEKLQYDLRRMESAYYDSNAREFELTRHVSLVMMNPKAILSLRKTGTCTFVIPEALYDLDFPGHYFRRIKSVSLNIPCIAGPYTSINATLRLLTHTTRINNLRSDTADNYPGSDYGSESDRFRHITGTTQAIATSGAQNDSGVFELNFHDERYLPFEGCGAFGEWQLELNTTESLRMFDYDTISDIILSIRYSAKEDNGTMKTASAEYLTSLIESAIKPTDNSGGLELVRMFSLKQEFSTEWHKFLFPATQDGDQVLSLTLTQDHFPFFARKSNLAITKLEIRLKSSRSEDYKMILSAINPSASVISTSETVMPQDTTMGNLQTAVIDTSTIGFNITGLDIFSPISLKFRSDSAADYRSIVTEPEEVSEIFLCVYYQLTE